MSKDDSGMADEVFVEINPEPSITCPNCQRKSFHPQDINEGYCGFCRAFTSAPITAYKDRDGWHLMKHEEK